MAGPRRALVMLSSGSNSVPLQRSAAGLRSSHPHCSSRCGMLFKPFRTRAPHIVEFGPIGIENPLLQSAPTADRRDQTGDREGDVNGRLGRWENRNSGAAHDNYPTWSVCRRLHPG